jgi:hypothetical protein
MASPGSDDLTDAQWAILDPLIPEPARRKDGRGRAWRPRRDVLNGILWILRTGAPRHDLLQSTTVTAGGTIRAYAESDFDTDGNLTETRQWDSQLAPSGPTTPLTSSSAIIRTQEFESHNADYGGGNLLREYDANGNRTEYTYGSYPLCSAKKELDR